MRNCPRYSRGSLDADEITRPVRKKIFFSTRLLVITSVPVFCPRLSHWSKSPGSIVRRLPERPIERRRLYPAVSLRPARGEGSRVRRSLALKKAALPATRLGHAHGRGIGGGVAAVVSGLDGDRVNAVLRAGAL